LVGAFVWVTLVRSQEQLDRVLDEIEESPGIVLFTLLEKELVQRLEARCKDINCESLWSSVTRKSSLAAVL